MRPTAPNSEESATLKPMNKLVLLVLLDKLVPKKGLEPPHPCGYMDLNHARLPIPPLRPEESCADHAGRQQFLVLQRHQTVSITRPMARSDPPQRGSLRQKEPPDDPSRSAQAHPRAAGQRDSPPLPRSQQCPRNYPPDQLPARHRPLDEDAKKWRTMLDNGVQQAAEINKQLREYIRGNS
jgi:hypothetical protein